MGSVGLGATDTGILAAGGFEGFRFLNLRVLFCGYFFNFFNVFFIFLWFVLFSILWRGGVSSEIRGLRN